MTSSLVHAAALYTFSNTGSQPYSFSFLEPGIITAPGDVAIPPFTIGASSFTQAAFGVECIAIAGAAGFADGDIGGCDVSPGSKGSAWLITNPPLNHPGTYSILGTSLGGAPPAPDHVTISEVSAYSYTFSNTGSQPYSFTFLEQNLLTAPGVFAVPPFTVDGSTFTQAAFNPECFSFATASGLVDASVSGCDVSSGWLIDSPGAIKPGTYHLLGSPVGSVPASPDLLTIAFLPGPAGLPEPTSLILFGGGLTGLALLALRRRA